MSYQPTYALLKEIKDPHVVQAILDTLEWDPSTLVNHLDEWPGVLPANKHTLYGKSAVGAVAVALSTTDPDFLDLASRDGRITVREAVLKNPACTQKHALLIAERASRRSSAQAQLLSTAIEKYLTPRQALDIINDDQFNPISVDRDTSLAVALTEKILQDPDYTSLLQEGAAGTYSGRYVTAESIARAAAGFQRGGVSGVIDAFPIDESARLVTALTWFGAAASEAPHSITPQDVECAYLPGVTAGVQWSPGISGLVTSVDGLPTNILKMMWVPEVVNLYSVGRALFETVSAISRDDIAEVLDLAVSFCESLSDETLNELQSDVHSRWGLSSKQVPITRLWSVPCTTLSPELLTRLREVALRYTRGEGEHLKRFVESVVALPEGTLSSLPADFLDPVLDRIPWGELEYLGKAPTLFNHQGPVAAWARGELPLKPTASALAAAFRGAPPPPRSHATLRLLLLKSTGDEAFVAGIEAAGAVVGGEPKAVARTFTLFFGGCAEAWKLGLSLLRDNQGADDALSLPAIAATACALSGIEPAYLQTQAAEVESEEEAPEVEPEPAVSEEPESAPEPESEEPAPLDENLSPEGEEPVQGTETADTPADGDGDRKTGITTIGAQFGFDF